MTESNERLNALRARTTDPLEHRDGVADWALRAAGIIGVIANLGTLEKTDPAVQKVIDELFVKMPTELSLLAAIQVTAQAQEFQAEQSRLN